MNVNFVTRFTWKKVLLVYKVMLIVSLYFCLPRLVFNFWHLLYKPKGITMHCFSRIIVIKILFDYCLIFEYCLI